MSTPHQVVTDNRNRIDELARIVFSLPYAATGDHIALAYVLRETIERHLERIAKRKEKPNEH